MTPSPICTATKWSPDVATARKVDARSVISHQGALRFPRDERGGRQQYFLEPAPHPRRSRNRGFALQAVCNRRTLRPVPTSTFSDWATAIGKAPIVAKNTWPCSLWCALLDLYCTQGSRGSSRPGNLRVIATVMSSPWNLLLSLVSLRGRANLATSRLRQLALFPLSFGSLGIPSPRQAPVVFSPTTADQTRF
jgi:hypothetical protein